MMDIFTTLESLILKDPHNLYPRVTKAVIEFLGLAGGLDFFAKRRKMANFQERSSKVIRTGVLIVYLYCNLKMTLCLWFSYRHDYLVYSHRKLLEHRSRLENCTSSCPSEEAADHAGQIGRAKSWAKMVGAPYLEVAFGAEVATLGLMIFTLYLYLIPRLYFNYIKNFESELLDRILDEPTGRESVNEMIDRVTQRLLPLNRAVKLLHKREWPHKPIEFHLAVLRSQGSLEPRNRSQKFCYEFCRMFCGLSVLFGVSLAVFGLFLMFVLTKIPLFKYHLQMGFMDKVLVMDIFLLLMISVLSISLYLTFYALYLWDQISAVMRLTRECWLCIKTNELSLLAGLDEQETGIDQRDRNLLEFIAKFKLFREATEVIIHTHNLFMFLLVQLGAFGPLLAYIHAPYMDRKLLTLQVAITLLGLFMLTTLWVPTCFRHSRCKSLCAALYSLRAHIARLEMEHKAGYHPHLVTVISKELREPKQLIDRFACQFSGLRFTYQDLLKYQFFFGIGMIAAYFADRQEDGRGLSLLALF